ncbi:MAG: hypothetical protein ABIG71_04345 [Candidatus Uhrbacteria bacterium]
MTYPMLNALRKQRRRILQVALIAAAIALVLSLVQPLRYGATMRLIIIQATSPTLDAFTAVKSSEKVGRNLGRVLVSSSFLDRVLLSNPDIDRASFSSDERKRRKAWEQMVESSVAAETSIMEVSVFHTRQAQARVIAETIGTVLVRDAREYTGSRDISVKVIDAPLVSRFPVRPNVIANTLLGFILGTFLGAAVLYLRGARH